MISDAEFAEHRGAFVRMQPAYLKARINWSEYFIEDRPHRREHYQYKLIQALCVYQYLTHKGWP